MAGEWGALTATAAAAAAATAPEPSPPRAALPLTAGHLTHARLPHRAPQVKSWSGATASDGVVEGSRGYALMRRSVLAAAQAAELEMAVAAAAARIDDD